MGGKISRQSCCIMSRSWGFFLRAQVISFTSAWMECLLAYYLRTWLAISEGFGLLCLPCDSKFSFLRNTPFRVDYIIGLLEFGIPIYLSVL